MRNATDWGEPSYAAVQLEDFTRHYTRALHLHHAYFFFAPDPGPSYLIAYKATYTDGRPAVEGRFPDLQRHFPRLLYHRHFMLSEQLANFYEERRPPPEEAGPEALAAWAARRTVFENRARAFRDHLRYVLGTDDVELTLIEHRQPTLFAFFEGIRPSDPRTYTEIPMLRDAPVEDAAPADEGPATPEPLSPTPDAPTPVTPTPAAPTVLAPALQGPANQGSNPGLESLETLPSDPPSPGKTNANQGVDKDQ